MRLRIKWKHKNGIDWNIIEMTDGYLLTFCFLAVAGLISLARFLLRVWCVITTN